MRPYKGYIDTDLRQTLWRPSTMWSGSLGIRRSKSQRKNRGNNGWLEGTMDSLLGGSSQVSIIDIATLRVHTMLLHALNLSLPDLLHDHFFLKKEAFSGVFFHLKYLQKRNNLHACSVTYWLICHCSKDSKDLIILFKNSTSSFLQMSRV